MINGSMQMCQTRPRAICIYIYISAFPFACLSCERLMGQYYIYSVRPDYLCVRCLWFIILQKQSNNCKSRTDNYRHYKDIGYTIDLRDKRKVKPLQYAALRQ